MHDDADDEALPQSVLPPGRRRLLVAVAVLVVLAVIVLAAVRVSDRSTSHAGPVSATVTPPRSPTATPGTGTSRPHRTSSPPGLAEPPAVLKPLRRLNRAELTAAHARCPRLAVTCMTTGETPAVVIAALRASFPRADHFVAVSDIAYSATSGPRLVFRRLSARAGRLRLAVVVRARQEDDATGSQRVDDDAVNIVRCQDATRRLTVEIQGSAPADRYVDIGRLRRAVADPRLLAIG